VKYRNARKTTFSFSNLEKMSLATSKRKVVFLVLIHRFIRYKLPPLLVYLHKSCGIWNCFWPRLGRLRSAWQQGYPTSERLLVQIPNPVAFLVQKLLIHDRRKPADRAEDMLYNTTLLRLWRCAPRVEEALARKRAALLSPKARRSIEAAPTAFLVKSTIPSGKL